MKAYRPVSVNAYISAGVSNSGIIYTVPAGRIAKLTYLKFFGTTSTESGVANQSLKINSVSADRVNEIFHPYNNAEDGRYISGTTTIYSTAHSLIDKGIYLNAGDYLSLSALSASYPASIFISLIEEYDV